MDKIAERVVWQSYAAKLKALTRALNFLADDSRTADIASVLRVPGTQNYKYDPPRPVTLLQASDQYIEQSAMLQAIDLAHGRLCPAVATKATPVNEHANGNGEKTERFPPDLERLASALATLDPDCDDPTWKFKRIAPIAMAAYLYPELSDALKKLVRSWSRGELRGAPSKAWTTPGQSNGLTGAEVFDSVWQRFYNDKDNGKRTSLGTIYFEAKEAGWVYTRTARQSDADEFEQCETTVEYADHESAGTTQPAIQSKSKPKSVAKAEAGVYTSAALDGMQQQFGLINFVGKLFLFDRFSLTSRTVKGNIEFDALES